MIRAKAVDISIPHQIRFLRRLVDKDRDECWMLNGINRTTYSAISINGEVIRGHRLSLLVFRGIKVPQNKMVCHTCDNKSCVNPYHLYIGDAFSNMKDAKSRGLLKGGGNKPRTHCFAGHEYMVVGFHKKNGNGRQCIACQDAYNKKYRNKLK